MNHYNIRRSFVIGYVIALAIICFFAWYTYYNMKRAEAESQHEEEVLKSLKAVENVLDDVQDMEASQRGFIISGDKVYLLPYHSALNRINDDSIALKNVLTGPDRTAMTAELLQLVKAKINFMEESIAIREDGGYNRGVMRVQSDTGRMLMENIRSLVMKIEDHERQTLATFGKSRKQADRQTVFLFIILSTLFIIFLVFFFIMERREIRRRFSSEVAREVDRGLVDFRDILDRINDGFIALDKNWNYVYVNQKACNIIGKKKEELLGKNMRDIYQKDIGNEFFEAYQKAMNTQQYVFLEASYAEWDTWFENHIYPSPRGITIYFKDISERKLSELKVQQLNEKLNTVAKATTDILWEANLVDNTLWLNDNFYEKFGYTDAGQFSESNAWEDFLHPDDKERVLSKISHLMHHTKETVWTDDYRFRKSDGSYLNIYDRCYILRDKNDMPTRLLGSMTDVTSLFNARQELQKKEEQYKTLVEQATDGIFIADHSGKFMVVNSSGCKLSQYSMEELSSMTIYDLAVPEDLRDNPPQFELMAREGGVRSERKMKKKDGSIIDVEVNAKFLSDGRFLAFIRDITERKITEEAIRASEKQLDLIYNTTSDILFLLSVEGDDKYRFQSVNRKFEEVIGFPGSEVIGKGIDEVFPGSILENNMHYYRTAIRNKQTVTWEEKADYPSGRRTGIVSISPFFNEKGECTRLVGSIHDITARKQAEDAILRSNERFELIAITTNDALWEFEFETGTGWGNIMHQQLYGLSQEDPIPDQQEWKARIHPEDRERVIESYIKALNSGENVWLSEYRFNAANNRLMTIYDRTYIKRDETGKPVRMMGSMIDITELKKAEQEIIKGKEMADKLIDSLPGVFYFYDSNGKFIRWNTQFEKVTGYTAEEIAGMHPTDFFDEPEKEYITKRIEGVFQHGINDAEALFMNKNGDKIPYYFKAVLLNYEGEPCLLGTGIDISERKKAEEELRLSEKKYRSLVEQAADSIFIFNNKGVIVDANPVSAKLLSYTVDELVNMSLSDILFKDEVEIDPIKFNELERGDSVIQRRNFRRKDGSSVPVEMHSRKMPDGKFLGIVRDLTERIEAGRQLEESYRQVRELTDHLQHIREEERAHIAREIHDELGQQLTVLKMDVSWLNKRIGAGDDEVKSKLTTLAHMLDGTVKTVRRISSELRPSLLDDLGLVAAMDWHLKEFGSRSGIKTEFSEPSRDMEMNETIKTGIFRIFQESLTNVARHAEAGKVSVDLQQDKGYIVLRIEDDGVGFNKLQVNNKRTLGILGMKERTNMMGGSYDITSLPGKGTVVVVSVPITSGAN